MSKPKSPWRTIEDAPWGSGRPFFIHSKHWDTPTTVRWVRSKREYVDECGVPVRLMDRPTHWMPIPPLPEGER